MSRVWIWRQRCPVYDLCWGSPRVPLGLSPSNYILEGWNRRNLHPYFHQLTALRVVICTYKELVGSKAIQIMCTVDDVWMLSARRISHNSPCLQVKMPRWWRPCSLDKIKQKVGSGEVTLSPLNIHTSPYPSLYLHLWLYHHSFSSGIKSHLHQNSQSTYYGRIILNCVCAVNRYHRD